MTDKYQWQEDALKAWEDNNYQGIVECATGSGKTRFAIDCIKKLQTNTLIIVPQRHLLHQWKKEILENTNIKEEEISFYYGDKKHKEIKPVTIAVINSARNIDFKNYFGLVICDECHHYASSINFTFLKMNNFVFNLGLTATLKREDDLEELLVEKLGKVIYRLSPKEGIKQKILSEFEIYNIPVMLNEEEHIKLENCNRVLIQHFREYQYDFNNLMYALKKGDVVAAKVIKAINGRKFVLTKAINKVKETIRLIFQHRKQNIIVFCEMQETAKKLYASLKMVPEMKVGIYISGMKNKGVVEKFRNGEINILISGRALDEGMDVKNADIGIIIGGSKTKRQIIQRLGRILRNEEGKKAILYQLYVNNTKDEDWCRRRTSFLEDFASKIYW